MKLSIPAISIGLLLALFVATGCGGGSSGESSTTGTGSEAVAKAAPSGREGESPKGEGESGDGGDSSESGSGSGGGETGSGSETGGGGKSPGTPDSSGSPAPKAESTSESKADYIVQANALCAKRQKQIQAGVGKIFESGGGEGSQKEALRKLVDGVIAPGLEAETEDLRALEPPKGDEGKIEAIIAATEAMVAEAREDPSAFVTSPPASSKAQRLAATYGIGACGKVS